MKINVSLSIFMHGRLLTVTLCALAAGLASPATFAQAAPIQTKKPGMAEKTVERR